VKKRALTRTHTLILDCQFPELWKICVSVFWACSIWHFAIGIQVLLIKISVK
jgi:hypothetical protein